MPQLNFSQPPFDVLTEDEQQSIKKHSQVRYLDTDKTLTEDDHNHFFVVLKGSVNEKLNDEFVTHYIANNNHNDWFKLKPEHTYMANEQSLLLQVNGSVIDKISAQNRLVRQLLNGELSDKIQALKSRQKHKNAKHNHSVANKQNQAETQQLMLQEVTSLPLLPVNIIDADSSLLTAAKTMTNAGLKHVLIQQHTTNERHPTKTNNNKLGILTDTDICKSLAEGKDPNTTTCQQYTNFKLRTITKHQDINDALLTMIRYRIHRLPVTDDDGSVLGVLGQTDLLAYLSHHSQLITVQIEQATDVTSLHAAVELIGKYIRTQQQNGIKVSVISKMVQTLNAQVFAKLWQLLVPEIVYENTCVIVMGSEGRGEQIMRTDQDNALIMRNGFNHPDIAEYAEQFNQHLAQMGYPLCDGNIMMTNPMWRQSLNRLEKEVSTWFTLKEPNHGVWLSAVLDSAYVCGDERLLDSLRDHIKVAHKNADPMFLRQFVRAALQFGEVNQWWQRFSPFGTKGKNNHAHDIDLKKAGIFPLVHGIRTLALENDILDVTNSSARLKALVRAGKLSEKKADAYAEALGFFMAQRLAVALSTDDKLARQVDPNTLSALERDLMKECLSVVKGFKNELTSHYQLNYA